MSGRVFRFRNKLSVSPADVHTDDAFAIKVVGVAGSTNDWAAYYGPSDWSNVRVAMSGDKINEAVAEELFPVMAFSGRRYRY